MLSANALVLTRTYLTRMCGCACVQRACAAAHVSNAHASNMKCVLQLNLAVNEEDIILKEKINNTPTPIECDVYRKYEKHNNIHE